ncbi:MAG: hypothetical protein ACR2OW_02015 [Methyloligellaceae bacterium]
MSTLVVAIVIFSISSLYLIVEFFWWAHHNKKWPFSGKPLLNLKRSNGTRKTIRPEQLNVDKVLQEIETLQADISQTLAETPDIPTERHQTTTIAAPKQRTAV